MIYPKIITSMTWKNLKSLNQINRILEDIADNILGWLKEKYSSRYSYQRLTQSKSGSFYLKIMKKRGRLTQIEKTNFK